MCHHAGTMRKVAWRHFRHAVYTRIHVHASGREKVSSGNLGSGTFADKTPAHWPRPTENWWSDRQSELLEWQNPETGPKLSADLRSTVFFKSANPLDLSPKSTIRELLKPKSADPRTYSPPSLLYNQLKIFYDILLSVFSSCDNNCYFTSTYLPVFCPKYIKLEKLRMEYDG